MPTLPISIPNTFATQSGNVPAAELDSDFSVLATAINACLAADNSGTPTAPLVWAQPLTLSPATGVALTLNGVAGQDVLDINPTQLAGVGFGINMQAAASGFNGDFRAIQVVNPSTGTANTIYGLMIGTNGSNQFLIGKTGASYVGTKFAGGPAGEVAWIWSGNTMPMVFAYGSGGGPNAAMQIDGTSGAVHIYQPTASSNAALTVGPNLAGHQCMQVVGNGTTDQSFGLNVQSGTSVNDWAVVMTNAAANANLLKIKGNGDFYIGWNGSANFISAASGSGITINSLSGISPVTFANGGSAAALAVIGTNYFGTGAQTATFSATNKPGSGTTAPTQWLTVNLNGTLFYIPCWQ
jgi:hypothetical protein